MALIRDHGNEALWHDVFDAHLDRYTDLWLYVDQYFKKELNVTLPLDVVRRVLDDMIWETNDHLADLLKQQTPVANSDEIARRLDEAISLFEEESDE